MKDHLGSIRAVVDSGRIVVSAQDFDMRGYTLPDRTYNITNAKYNLTGKEKDTESGYDYFGARYLHSRKGRWTSTDPHFEKHYDYTPYNYVLNNTLMYYNSDGRQRNAIMKMQPIQLLFKQ